MKLIVDIEEVKNIVFKSLKEQGLSVNSNGIEVTTATYGEFDDAITEITGLSFELSSSPKL